MHTEAACPNCDTALTGHHCSHCGQAVHHSARSVRALLHEVFEDLTHLDGRMLLTLRTLALRPGQITVDHLADRRARYLPPFRLYLVMSVLFFALGLIDGDGGNNAGKHAVTPPSPASAPAAKANNEGPGSPAFEAALKEMERDPDAGWLARGLRQGCGVLPDWGQGALVGACQRAWADRGQALLATFVHNLPRTMFVVMPVAALVLLVLFGRSRRFYVEHVIFTLHLQTAAYLFFTVGTLLLMLERAVPGMGIVVTPLCWALLGYGVWYFYRALRAVYREPQARTVTKMLAFAASYGVILAMALLGTFVISALTA
jgi:hypothetical protein